MKLMTSGAMFLLPFFYQSVAVSADEPQEKESKPATEARGYLGVLLSPVPEALQAHMKVDEGALVQQVSAGSPAEKAGLRKYDVIVSVNGQKLKGPEEVRKRIHDSRVGETLKLGVRRGNENLTLEAALGAAPVEALEREEPKERTQRGFLGVGFAPVPVELAFHLNLEEGAGVVVVDVAKGSPAEKAGIENKDVLVAVGGRRIERSDDFSSFLAEKKAGEEVQVEVIHRGEKKTVKAVLTTRPKRMPRGHFRPGEDFDPNFPHFLRPHSLHRGKIILRGPDGHEDSYTIPDAFFRAGESAEELIQDLEERFGEFRDNTLPEWKEGLRKSLRQLEEKLRDNGADPDWSTGESQVSVYRILDNDYDITVRDQNGQRTVTVKQGKKSLAQDLPYDQLDTLPQEVRERVQKATEGLPASKKKAPALRLPRLEEDGERIRA